jgi:flagellar export protein FliJ
MAFRYPFQSILRLRQSLERQEEQRLFAIAATVARLRLELEEFEGSRMERWRIASEEMMAGSSGAVLQFAALCEANAATVHSKLRVELADAEQQRLKQLYVYQQARQKREIFEKLRDRQEENYDREAVRHEQEQADDSFLMRSLGKVAD